MVPEAHCCSRCCSHYSTTDTRITIICLHCISPCSIPSPPPQHDTSGQHNSTHSVHQGLCWRPHPAAFWRPPHLPLVLHPDQHLCHRPVPGEGKRSSLSIPRPQRRLEMSTRHTSNWLKRSHQWVQCFFLIIVADLVKWVFGWSSNYLPQFWSSSVLTDWQKWYPKRWHAEL